MAPLPHIFHALIRADDLPAHFGLRYITPLLLLFGGISLELTTKDHLRLLRGAAAGAQSPAREAAAAFARFRRRYHAAS